MYTFGLFLLPALAHAVTLALLRPLQAQLPRIARPSVTYAWSFEPSTFVIQDGADIDTQSISYSATGLPPWLTLRQDTLSFVGITPSTADASSFTIVVTASGAGQTINDTFQLLVSANPEPQLAIPFAQQIVSNNLAIASASVVQPGSALAPYFSMSAAHNGKAGVRIPPGWSFSIGLDGGTFLPWPIVYYASLADGTPLPEWIRYDPPSFTFNGLAPSENVAPMEVLLMATDVAGFSTNASDSFWVSVAAHELGITDATKGIHINVTVDEYIDTRLSYELLHSNLSWDGLALPVGSLDSVDVGPSENVVFDRESLRLVGPVMGPSALDIPMRVTDIQNLTLHTMLYLIPVPSVFKTPTNETLSSNLVPLGNGSFAATFDANGEWKTSLEPFLSETGIIQVSRRQVEFIVRLDRPSNATLRFDVESLRLLVENVGPESKKHDKLEPSEQYRVQVAKFDSPPPHDSSQPLSMIDNSPKLDPVEILVVAFSSEFNTNSTIRFTINPTNPTNCGSPSTCSTGPAPTTTNQALAESTKGRFAMILAATLLSLLMVALILLCIYKRGACLTCFPSADKVAQEKSPYVVVVRGADSMMRGRRTGEDEIERGVSGKLVLDIGTCASGGTVAATRSDTPSEQTVCSRPETIQVASNELPNEKESRSETSGSHYENSSSAQGANDVGAVRSGIALGEMRWQVGGLLIGRSSPVPSQASEIAQPVGKTVPKHTFFANVRSPLSSPVNTSPASVVGAPLKTNLLGGIVPMLKETSLGSLLGLSKSPSHGISSGSLGTAGISHSQDSREAFKATISKPQPVQRSLPNSNELPLGTALGPGGLVVRQRSDDGGVGFIAGTAVIYPKETRATDLSTKAATDRLDPPLNVSGTHLFVTEVPAAFHDVPTLLRKRSNESKAAGYINEGIGTSSQSTIAGSAENEVDTKVLDQSQSRAHMELPQAMTVQLGSPEIPLLRKAVYISESLQSGRIPTDISSESVVLATATLAVRSRHPGGVMFVPSPKAGQRDSPDDFIPPSSPLTDLEFPNEPQRGIANSKPRLVEFVNEVQYDAGSSSDGGNARRHPAPARYEGKRERSQKAVVGGLSGTPPSHWDELVDHHTPSSRVAVIPQATSTRLVDQVLFLREQSRQRHTGQTPGAVVSTRAQMSSQQASDLPTSGSFFHDINTVHDPRYAECSTSDEASPTSGHHRHPQQVFGGSGPNIATARQLHTNSGDETDGPNILFGPPQIPLPRLPSHSSNYFDLSESSSLSSSDSAVIRHTSGMDRILVGAREPFHFLAPLRLENSSPGKIPRNQALDSLLREARSGRLEARQAFGSALPAWLNFDDKLAEFWGVPSVDLRGKKLEVILSLCDGVQTRDIGQFLIEIVGH